MLAKVFTIACIAVGLSANGGCQDSSWQCQFDSGLAPDYSHAIGCETDFATLASDPVVASIPGARATKIIYDRFDGQLYFQNSNKYLVHHDFATEYLSVASGKPFVPPLFEFNQSAYYSLDRRFILGTLVYYDGPAVWALEIAPYDTATADLVATAYDAIRDSAFFGRELYFHPSSDSVARVVEDLPDSVKIITTEELFAGIQYQPLNLGISMGRLKFLRADQVDSEFLSFRDIVVLDEIPNDISVVMGIVTESFQTPLSHINVLSQNRGTPNMALRGAFDDMRLRGLDGAWVQLDVGAFDYAITEVTKDQADAWWDANRPTQITIPDVDVSVTELRDLSTLLALDGQSLGEALAQAIPAFGGKASHYGGLTQIGDAVPHPRGFAVPVYYFLQFLDQNGFDDRIAALSADEGFQSDPAIRFARLEELRADMRAAPVDPAFEAMLLDKIDSEYAGIRLRFRSSTNAEDLDGFTGAGLYTSASGDRNDPARPVMAAVRKVWASTYNFRAWEERAYRGIEHLGVGMALLVHRSFPDEEANGVALTGNIFDLNCIEPGFYVNVQKGETSVVKPPPGIHSDQFIYHHYHPTQDIQWLTHSTLVAWEAREETVISRAQTRVLGDALAAIHDYFASVYGPQAGDIPCETFYAMDVEFKFEDDDVLDEPALFVKQARPHPGWGQ